MTVAVDWFQRTNERIVRHLLRVVKNIVNVSWFYQYVCVFIANMKCGTILFYVFSQILVVFSVTIEDEVQTLKIQLNSLLQQRHEEYNQLEESLKKTLNKNIEIDNLKNEIKELRWAFAKFIIFFFGFLHDNEKFDSENIRYRQQVNYAVIE